MVKIGMVIGGRYEIQELIGTGGMSDVYRARCNKLNRNVAVKVLKQEFSENRDFVAKFRREAEAAANLMHPNIVTVYDVGEDNGISYIVMELVEGCTLKEYIEKKSRLAINECISIAIPIASGIEAAHNMGIIHRDIKPQNVIISQKGIVKVTDFGIAKTTTSNTISSNVMGSVHYTSPEQARGGFSDEKSDIYSLGITMFEMVTGRVPFNGDTTVAIAIKHIQEEMPSPRIYVENIPISIEQIILKCTQKSPDRRYQKMGEVIEDLKKAYISPNENFVKIDTYEQNSVTKTNLDPVYRRERRQIQEENRERDNNLYPGEQKRPVKKTREELELPQNVRNSSEEPVENIVKKNPQPAKKPGGSQPVKKKPNPSGKTNGQQAKTKPKKPSKKKTDDTVEKVKSGLIIGIAIVIGILFLYLIGCLIGIFGKNNNSGKYVSVPNVVNMNVEDAKTYFDKAKLGYTITYVESDSAPNKIMETKPSKNTDVLEGSVVELIVSTRKEQNASGFAVPNVVGKTEAEATSALENEGFKVEKLSEQSEEYPKGTVIAQSPNADEKAEYNSVVTITISLGSTKEKVLMPDLTNKTEEEARKAVSDVGMTVTGVTEVYSDTVEKGKVCGQSYTANSVVKEGTEVTLKISLGPEPRYYDCNIVVQAPEKYTGGNATVILKTIDGQTELYNQMTSSFPVPINLSQIYGTARGIVYITYTVMIPEETTDADGNVYIQNVPAEDTVSYEVDFQ